MKISILVLLTIFSIESVLSQDKKAQKIVNKAIEKHGGKHYRDAHFAYDFRKHHYVFHYTDGQFTYERHHKDAPIVDVLTNKGFQRLMDGKAVVLSDKDSRKYSNSVNSVHYFAFLPFFLNDVAVNKKYLGTADIAGTQYHKIQVTFDQEGGGDDHDDIYIYWFDTEDYSMDYLAYSFHVDEGGVRFRKAYNVRKIGGITFQDYVNYKHHKETPVAQLDKLYEKGELIELSRIELENITAIDGSNQMNGSE